MIHKFWYRLYMAYLDLDELESLPQVRSLVSERWFSIASFLPRDHPVAGEGSLSDRVRDLVEQQAGTRPGGPVRLLTQLRLFGYYFSPLNLFYCFDASGTKLEAIVAEVTNTPWREKHYYVLSEANRTLGGTNLRYAHAKGFHVSPFMDLDYQYQWELSVPDEKLKVRLENHAKGARAFDASLALTRRSLSRWQLSKMLVRYPVMTGEIMAAIYWQAFKLWWKKCPVYSHPVKHEHVRQAN